MVTFAIINVIDKQSYYTTIIKRIIIGKNGG